MSETRWCVACTPEQSVRAVIVVMFSPKKEPKAHITPIPMGMGKGGSASAGIDSRRERRRASCQHVAERAATERVVVQAAAVQRVAEARDLQAGSAHRCAHGAVVAASSRERRRLAQRATPP